MAQKSIQSFFSNAKSISTKSSNIMSAASASVNKTPKQISTSPKKALESTTEKSLSAVSKITSPIKSNPEVKLPKLQAEQPEDKQSDEEVTTSPIVKASKKRKSHRIIDSDEENVPENVSKEVKTDSNETEQLQNSDDEIQEVAPPEKPGQTEESRKSSEKKANKLSSQPPSKKVKESKTPKSEKKTNSKPTPKSSAPTSEKKTKVASNAKELSSVASMLTPKSDKAKLGEEKSSEISGKKEPAPEPKPDPSPVDSSKKANTSTTSATDFAPNTESYRPIEGAFWKEGEQMPYLALAKTFKLIEEEPSRLKITLTLTNLFRSAIRLSPKDVLSCVYLSLNKLGPAYEGQELGIGETLLMKALAQATGRNVDKIKENLHSVGDLGIVAEQSRTSQKMLFVPARLTVKTVFDKLKSISEMSGNSVMSKKIEKIRSLLVACQECEARFILRTLAGKLRIGLAEQTVLTSLGQAFAAMESDKNSDKALNEVSEYKKRSEDIVYLVKSTYCEHPNLENIIKAVLEHGIDDLSEHCKLTPGIPLKPMLAHPAKGVQDILSRLDAKGAFTSEYKYDGERAQIHIFDKQVKIFSRNQEDNSTKYPDVVKIAESIVKESVRSCIIDSEIVAWDAEKKSILPFQVLTTRKRKDVQEENIKVQVCIYAFDMLYLNGESMVPKSLRERRDAMRNSLNEIEGKLAFATCSDTNDTDEIAVFLDESIKGNCEGLMIKTLDSYASYEIARRSHNWLKLKKDYLEGIGDTLDLVVIGGYKGKGKRSGVFGGFLLACYDEDAEEYQSICKIGTGFSELQLVTLNTQFSDCQLDTPPTYYSFDSTLQPDAWFEPNQVWEVKAADLSLSPVHRAAMGIVESGKGISLRFPRFIRCRDDKTPEQATGAEQVAKMYNSQDQIKNANKLKGQQDNDDYDDFY